ncbi:MAG: NAD(+) diphosphatase [Woeseiaceae bacterium]|nr:NAD(+) diphosphatase [Woeseiaceae bacterium]
MEDHNVFAGAFVDRNTQRRKDSHWLDTALLHENTRFIPICGDYFLIGGDPLHLKLLERHQVESLLEEHNQIFIGLFRGNPTFAIMTNKDKITTYRELGELQDLRSLGSAIPADEANLAAHARGLALWHGSQQFCGQCGSSTYSDNGGNSRRCMNIDCNRAIFPRVDPAIIVLVTDGDRCLLGRQAGWPEGRYSTIAGFVEPGESPEDAVCREVFEETNIRVCDVCYSSSQPWPFPSSLMLGFITKTDATVTQEIRLNDGELEDAAWFTRKELTSGFPKLPLRISIARRLIDGWLSLEG